MSGRKIWRAAIWCVGFFRRPAQLIARFMRRLLLARDTRRLGEPFDGGKPSTDRLDAETRGWVAAKDVAQKAGGRAVSITDLPIWQKIEPYVRVEVDARTGGGGTKHRYRIELAKMPGDLQSEALGACMPCVACGTEIHPIRARKAARKRGDAVVGLYYAPTCSLYANMGCARGGASKAEYDRIGAMFYPVRMGQAAPPAKDRQLCLALPGQETTR